MDHPARVLFVPDPRLSAVPQGLINEGYVKAEPLSTAYRPVIAVVAFHSGVPLATGALIGVDICFVLSGFLITTRVRAEVRQTGTLALGRFYWRRALRLWPPLRR